MACECDPVGIDDIAQRLGKSRQTVKGWKWAGILPEPAGVLSGRPWWQWSDIAALADEDHRFTPVA